ncbi:hypothetical protein [Hymenobacter metallilatus]|uniref:Glycosyltransferase RgtA/B/C/D-like domain-containing protein n=1 Tax=Hymenobacter metallilatus TaxID=2493666 RepID=A0A428JR45_9BACT|nr:hypothetical protein [Hymenobacter metallilatus]RSK36034.1 hypothetical protein EI290_03845 [Hymenobacter metallilatus]
MNQQRAAFLAGYLYRCPAAFFLILLTLVSGWFMWYPDRIPINNGFGFEGAYFYRAVALDFYRAVFVEGVNAYSIQRILPFGLLHYFFRLTGIAFTDANLLRYFEWYNLVVGGLVVYYWDQLARLLRLGPAAVWIGYLSLLVSFATLKYDTYVPFTYDRTALLVGLMSLYYHLARHPGRLLLTALASLLVWPTALYCNIVLLVLPPFLRLPRRGNKPLSVLWAAGSSLALAGLCVLTLYIKRIELGLIVAPMEYTVLPLSIGLITLYVAFTQYEVARVLGASPANLLKLGEQVLRQPRAWVAVLVLVAAFLGLTRGLGRQGTEHLNVATFLTNMVYGAVTRPLQSLVAHSNYYGLPVVLGLLYWRRVLLAVRQLGLAVGGLLVLLLLLSVNCETRQLANLLPVLVVGVAMAVQQLKPRPWAVAVTTGLYLVQSKVWLRINAFDPTFGQPQDQFPLGNGPGSEYVWNSPFQAYWMNVGPWTSNQFLLIQAVVLLAMLAAIRWLYGPVRLRKVNTSAT